MSACLMIAAMTTATVAAQAEAALPDQVAELPVAIAAIIDAAIASGDRTEIETVVRTTKRALPEVTAAIDRHLAGRIDTAIGARPFGSTVLASQNPKDSSSPASPLPPIDSATLKWSGEGEAGAFVNTGNAPGIGLVGGFKMLVEGQNWRVGTNARADYQETNGVITREQYRFSAEPNYKFDERGYIFGLGQYEQDRFQGFASRYSLSGGLGYSVVKSEAARLSVKAGPAWRVTEPVAAARESVVAGLASLEAKVKITPSLEYSQDASIYSDATGSTFYTLAALDSKLVGKLKARFSYMIQHETAPELGRFGTDTTSRLSLVYGF